MIIYFTYIKKRIIPNALTNSLFHFEEVVGDGTIISYF